MELEVLRVLSYGETPEQDLRITISPMNVLAIVAENEDSTIQGRAVRRVDVLLGEGEQLSVVVNHQDLELLERAIGSFCLG